MNVFINLSYIVILLYFSRVMFILAKCLADNIEFSVFKNIYKSEFYLSVLIYLYLFIYLFIIYVCILKLLIFL